MLSLAKSYLTEYAIDNLADVPGLHRMRLDHAARAVVEDGRRLSFPGCTENGQHKCPRHGAFGRGFYLEYVLRHDVIRAV